MKFDTILNYQKTDIELRKIHDEIERSALNQAIDKARSEFNSAKAQVSESEKNAEVLVKFVANAEKLYAEGKAVLEETAAKLDGTETDEERSAAIAKLETVRKKMSEIERKLAEVKPRADKTIKDYKTGQDKGKKMRDEYNSAKEALEQLRKSKEPIVNELKAKLTELEKDIDPKLMELYNALKAESKYPAFVEALPGERGTYSCRGCGIGLPQKLKSELEDKGFCRCETCRRIVYRK